MMPSSVVVTGCGSGIGRAIITRLAADGWRAAGIEINANDAASIRKERGATHVIIEGDAADRAILAKTREAAESLAPLGGWVNNVGIAIMSNLHDPKPAEVERLISVNLMSHYWGCSEAIRSWVERRSKGAIDNISSVHASTAFNIWASFDVAKAGIDALTRYIAVEYGPVGIRANSIRPGAIATELVRRVIADSPDPVVAERENVNYSSARTHRRTV